jgi:hypothetical protein
MTGPGSAHPQNFSRITSRIRLIDSLVLLTFRILGGPQPPTPHPHRFLSGYPAFNAIISKIAGAAIAWGRRRWPWLINARNNAKNGLNAEGERRVSILFLASDSLFPAASGYRLWLPGPPGTGLDGSPPAGSPFRQTGSGEAIPIAALRGKLKSGEGPGTKTYQANTATSDSPHFSSAEIYHSCF